MFTSYEFERINTEYKRLAKERKTKTVTIWSIILVLVVLFDLFMVFVTDWMEHGEGRFFVPIYGGVAFAGVLIALIVSIYGTSSKPIYNYLFKEIYQHINLSEEKQIDYKAFPKVDNAFVGQGGLFSRHARVEAYRSVASTYEGVEYHIIDCMLITGSGKNQAVHLNGIYFYFKKHSSSLLQVRSNGSPKYHGHKYDKVDASDLFKVYVEEGKTIQTVDRTFIQNIKELKHQLQAKKVYLSITNDEIHFAYVPSIQWRKLKHVSLQTLNEVYKNLLEEENIIKELLATSNLNNSY